MNWENFLSLIQRNTRSASFWEILQSLLETYISQKILFLLKFQYFHINYLLYSFSKRKRTHCILFLLKKQCVVVSFITLITVVIESQILSPKYHLSFLCFLLKLVNLLLL